MPCEVLRTPIAATQSAALRGPNKKALDAWLDDLAQRGCAALSYRLSGEVVEHLCVKHIRGALRAVVAFTSEDTAWLPLVAPHNREPGTDVYEALYRLIGREPEPGEERSKPPCCGDATSGAPLVDEVLIDDLVRRTRALTRRAR